MINKLNTTTGYFSYYKPANVTAVTLPVYRKVVNGFVKFIMRKVFEGFDVHLSAGESLGIVGIRGEKIRPRIDEVTGEIKGVTPSWGKTNKLWKEDPAAKERGDVIYCFNEHTGGIRYKIVWHKTGMKLHNKSYYILNFMRVNKRTMWRSALEGKEYMVNPVKAYQNGQQQSVN